MVKTMPNKHSESKRVTQEALTKIMNIEIRFYRTELHKAQSLGYWNRIFQIEKNLA